MAILEILEYPDPRLRQASLPVEDFDDGIGKLADDLIETLHASSAIGLSAPQVDARLRMLVMDHSPDRSRPELYINPQVLARSRFGFVEERCLSVPDVVAHVIRATRIKVRAFDRQGASFERELDGMPAVCLQHEMDHFDGKLLVDRINWFKRRRLRAAIAKARRAGDEQSGVAA